MEQFKLRRSHQDFASYFQDDWRVSRKLTLSLGLRYELQAHDGMDNRTVFGCDRPPPVPITFR
jgi:outer membrane receptor protein involved in Fe transport